MNEKIVQNNQNNSVFHSNTGNCGEGIYLHTSLLNIAFKALSYNMICSS